MNASGAQPGTPSARPAVVAAPAAGEPLAGLEWLSRGRRYRPERSAPDAHHSGRGSVLPSSRSPSGAGPGPRAAVGRRRSPSRHVATGATSSSAGSLASPRGGAPSASPPAWWIWTPAGSMRAAGNARSIAPAPRPRGVSPRLRVARSARHPPPRPPKRCGLSAVLPRPSCVGAHRAALAGPRRVRLPAAVRRRRHRSARLPVAATAAYQIGQTPLLWWNAARTEAVVSATVLSGLRVIATNLAAGHRGRRPAVRARRRPHRRPRPAEVPDRRSGHRHLRPHRRRAVHRRRTGRPGRLPGPGHRPAHVLHQRQARRAARLHRHDRPRRRHRRPRQGD